MQDTSTSDVWELWASSLDARHPRVMFNWFPQFCLTQSTNMSSFYFFFTKKKNKNINLTSSWVHFYSALSQESWVDISGSCLGFMGFGGGFPASSVIPVHGVFRLGVFRLGVFRLASFRSTASSGWAYSGGAYSWLTKYLRTDIWYSKKRH